MSHDEQRAGEGGSSPSRYSFFSPLIILLVLLYVYSSHLYINILISLLCYLIFNKVLNIIFKFSHVICH
jgi:hypothetical protein